MRLIKMIGGLGNQMFIYAFYLQMKRRFPTTRIDLSDIAHYHAHNGYELHRVFPHADADELCLNQTAKKVIEFLFFKTILERHQPADSLRPFFRPRLWPFTYFKGFYQSERYFADIADDVRRAFSFDLSQASEKTCRLLATIKADDVSVSIHVRRGDYLKPSVWRNTGCVCSAAYYQDAVSAVLRRLPNAHFYVFSDDMAWASANLRLGNATFVSWNSGNDSWQDMMLMSRCHHNIVCNSTFSWWGAWLNAHTDKMVIAPARWSALADMPNVCPDSWTLIPVTIAQEQTAEQGQGH